MTAPKTATVKDVYDYFKREGDTLKSFTIEWRNMSDQDKTDLKTGLSDGTFDY